MISFVLFSKYNRAAFSSALALPPVRYSRKKALAKTIVALGVLLIFGEVLSLKNCSTLLAISMRFFSLLDTLKSFLHGKL